MSFDVDVYYSIVFCGCLNGTPTGATTWVYFYDLKL